MHPHQTGELARIRAQDIARESAAHHAHHVQRPGFHPAGFVLTVSPRERLVRTRRSVARFRSSIGVALIRVGIRFLDPDLGGVHTPR